MNFENQEKDVKQGNPDAADYPDVGEDHPPLGPGIG
jgi:hypothetical protein